MPCSSSRSANVSDVSPAGTSSQRYIVASLPATRMPLRAKRSSRSARLRPYRARVSATCASSPHATTEARWTNSCGAVPTVGRNAFSAPISVGSPAAKPLRYPVIELRFESVLKTITLVRSASCSADAGGSSNQSSVYASSEATTKPCSRASPASRS